MNKFTLFPKIGGSIPASNEYLVDHIRVIRRIFDELSTACYCDEIEIFHIAMRVDGEVLAFGDREGCNKMRLSRKQNYIANSISFGESIWSDEMVLHNFLRSNLLLAFQQMIAKLRKEKIQVDGDLLLKDLSKKIELYMT